MTLVVLSLLIPAFCTHGQSKDNKSFPSKLFVVLVIWASCPWVNKYKLIKMNYYLKIAAYIRKQKERGDYFITCQDQTKTTYVTSLCMHEPTEY